MNKIVPVLGVAAALTLAGCKDPNYRRFGESSQAEPTPVVEQTPADEQAAKTPEPAPVQTVEVTPEPVPVQEPTPAPVVTPVEPETTVYIVQKGDYLGKIANKYNLKVNDIKMLNNLKSDKILLGQKLKLPGKIDVGEQTVPEGAKAPSKSVTKKAFEPYTGETVEYVVKSGDMLGKIAYANGINIRQLKALNNLKNDNLKIGQKLRIPAKGAVAQKAAPKAEPVAQAVAPKAEPVAQEAAPVASVAEPAAEAAAPVAPVAGETTYIVQENEDLMSIAVSMGLSPAVLREMNNLPEDAVLTAGQTLKVPADSQE